MDAVKIQGSRVTGTLISGQRFSTYAPNDPTLVETLVKNSVQVKAEPQEEAPWYVTVLVSWFPMLLLIGVWIFFMRQMQSGGGKAMSFGRSRAKMVTQETRSLLPMWPAWMKPRKNCRKSSIF